MAISAPHETFLQQLCLFLVDDFTLAYYDPFVALSSGIFDSVFFQCFFFLAFQASHCTLTTADVFLCIASQSMVAKPLH